MESTSIYAALAAVQSELKAPKGQMNTFGGYRYRSCEDILEAVKPILKAHDLLLTLSDEPKVLEGWHYIEATAKLESLDGGCISVKAYAREPEQKTKMDAAQVTGTSSSYARKYALNGPVLHRRYQGCRHGRVSCGRRSKPRRCEQAAEAACSEA